MQFCLPFSTLIFKIEYPKKSDYFLIIYSGSRLFRERRMHDIYQYESRQITDGFKWV